MNNFGEAIVLMAVGMSTVFSVLVLVILTGKLLIFMVNKYAPEEEQPEAKRNNTSVINPSVANAIMSAVNTITGGKGKVEKIEKLSLVSLNLC